MHGHHAAELEAEFLMHDLGHGSEAVGGAGGVGQNVVLGGIIHVLVHAHDHGEVGLLGRSGNDDLLGAAFQMHAGLRSGTEDAGGFHHDIHVQILPGQVVGIAFGEAGNVPVADLDHGAVNAAHGSLFRGDFAGEGGRTVGAVMLKQMEIGVGVHQIVDGHDFGSVTILAVHGTKDLTTDTAEAVDSNSYLFHDSFPLPVRRALPVKISNT